MSNDQLPHLEDRERDPVPVVLVHVGGLHGGPGDRGHLCQGWGRVPAQSDLCPGVRLHDGLYTTGTHYLGRIRFW